MSFVIILLTAPNIIRVIKLRRVKLAEHVVPMGQMTNEYKLWSENLKGIDNLEDLDIDKRIILKWILEK